MHGDHWHAQSISGIQIAQILEPICGFASPNPRELLTGHRRFLSQHPHQEIDDPEPFPPPFIGCRVCNTHRFLLSSWLIQYFEDTGMNPCCNHN